MFFIAPSILPYLLPAGVCTLARRSRKGMGVVERGVGKWGMIGRRGGRGRGIGKEKEGEIRGR